MRRVLNKREWLVFGVLCGLCLTALSLPTPDRARLARTANRAFLLPWLLVKDDVEGYVGLREENVHLRAELERRSLEVAELEWNRVENARLRAALGFRDRTPVQLVAAEVIGRSGEGFPHALLIDKGSRDGLRPNQPVVTPDGLVGKTVETDPNASLVLTLRHPDFRASAMALADGELEVGIAAAGAAGELELLVPMRSSAGAGDTVITSGIGPVFPRGIPIGRLSETTGEDRLKLQKNDRILPAVDLNRVTTVFVLLESESATDRVAWGSTLFWPGYEHLGALAADSSAPERAAGLIPRRP